MADLYIANPHGFCFGVSRAIDLAVSTAKKYQENIYFLGQLVHNQHVIDWLESELNIKTVNSIEEIPFGAVVIIRAHGTSPSTFKQATAKGLKVVDATCPLVVKSHQDARNYLSQGKKIFFLCNDINHDETVGVVGEDPNNITPIAINEVANFYIPNAENSVVMTQTTLSNIETQVTVELLKDKYPEITVAPHICQATTERQNAVVELTQKCTLIIIVGSPASANSRSLQQVASAMGAASYIIDNAKELEPDWFKGHQNIGLSSGASTPETILDEVVSSINQIIHP